MFARYAGSRFNIDGGEVRILNDDEILAKIQNPEDILHFQEVIMAEDKQIELELDDNNDVEVEVKPENTETEEKSVQTEVVEEDQFKSRIIYAKTY